MRELPTWGTQCTLPHWRGQLDPEVARMSKSGEAMSRIPVRAVPILNAQVSYAVEYDPRFHSNVFALRKRVTFGNEDLAAQCNIVAEPGTSWADVHAEMHKEVNRMLARRLIETVFKNVI